MQFPDLTPLDLAKLCPKFTAVMERKNGIIYMGEIQALQYELEYILTKTLRQFEALETALQSMDNSLKKKEKKIRKNSTEVKEKRLSFSEDKPSKKFKDSGGKAQNSPASGRVKSKNIQTVKSQDFDFSNSPAEIPKLQKSDSSSRFWSLIEPYCADICQDDIKTLEEWIKLHERNAEYLGIPPLGEHFASKWIQEDILEEIKEGSKSVECPKGLTDAATDDKVDELFKRVENNLVVDSSHQPLAERLVSCLVEENLMTSLDDVMTDTTNEEVHPSTTNVVKTEIGLSKLSLEKRLWKDLSDLGLIEAEMETNTDDDNHDELYSELKRLQEALIPMSNYNLKQKKSLWAMAKAEMSKQEIKKKVQEADAKVMEVYRAIAAARSKGRKLTKKEQEQTYKMLSDREELIKKLENLH